MLYEYFPAARLQRELRYHERQRIKPRDALTVLESAEIGIEDKDNNGGIVTGSINANIITGVSGGGTINMNIVVGVQGIMSTSYLTVQKK
jgi:N-acetyl-gamma-glutamylphosphate reductase